MNQKLKIFKTYNMKRSLLNFALLLGAVSSWRQTADERTALGQKNSPGKSFLFSATIMILFMLFGSSVLMAQISQTYYGSGTFTVPAGVTTVTINAYGGAGGSGGIDCGAGCASRPGGEVGYVSTSYGVSEGSVLYLYPGGAGGNGASNKTNGGGGGYGGSSSYSSAYNGGAGGGVGTSGASGGGGGGGAATLVSYNSAGNIIIVAGGAGGGGGACNTSGSGTAGSSSTSPHGSTQGGAGSNSASADGGGGGGGGGGLNGSVGGTTYPLNGESAGYGGYRGANSSGSGTSTISGRVVISYTAVGGTASASPTALCSGSSATISLSGYAGTIQWQISSDNSNWSYTGVTASSFNTGALTATRYYRALISGSVPSSSCSVIVYPPTTSPSSASCTNKTTTTADLSWGAATGQGTITYYWVVSTNSNETYESGTIKGTTTGATRTAQATNLSPGTGYYLKVKASAECGETTYTSTSFITLIYPPEPSAATNLRANSFTANWAASPGALYYSLDVSTNSDFSSYVSGYQNRNVGLATNLTISGLSNNTVYYYRLRANGAGGTSLYSSTISLKTLPVNNFLIEKIGGGNIGTQLAGQPFSIKITARDAEYTTVNDFTGTVNITSTSTLIGTPVTSGNFVGGVLSSQSVTLTGAGIGDKYLTASIASPVVSSNSNSFTVDPAAINHWNLVANGPITAGEFFTVTATVYDVYGNLKTNYTGPNNLSWTTTAISSPNNTARILPPDGAQIFSNGTATIGGFKFFNSDPVAAGKSLPTISVTDGPTAVVGTTDPITVTNAAINNFLVESGTGTSASFSPGTSMIAGTPFSVKVTARDIYWNTHKSYNGTVRFKTSNDALTDQSAGVHYPANYTYNASEQGIHVFENLTTIHETGAYWMRVGEGAALAKSGIQEGIVVGPGAFDPSQSTLVLAPATPTIRTAGDYVQVEFVPKDAYNNLLCVATGDKTIKLNDLGTDHTNDYNGEITETILKAASLATGSFSSNVRVTKAGTNTITAWYNGSKFSTDIDIEVSPAETSYYTINNVTSIIAGETRAAYTISRYDEFGNLQKSGNETITLSSNATGPNEKFYTTVDGATPVTTITLADGSGSANFWYYDEKAGDWMISATGLSGLSAITDAITVVPGATNHFHLTSPSDITAGGTRAAYTVTRHDQFSNEVNAGDQTVYLHSTSTGVNKKFYSVATGGTPTSSITIAGSSSTANFWYYDEKTSFFGTDGSGTDAEWTITASDEAVTPNGTDSGIIDGTDGIKVLPTTIANAPNSFEITTSGTTSYYGDPQTITVKAMDTYGNVKTNYTGFIKFSNTDTKAINPAENQTLVNGSKTFTDGVIFSSISSGPDHWWLTVLNQTGTLFGGKTFVVLPRPITITAGSNQTKTYGDTKDLGNTAFSVTSSLTPILKEGERITNVTLVSPGTPASANVGDYAITPSAATGDGGFVASNYAINYSTAGKLTVNPAELIVTAIADQTKVYGQSDPTLTYSVSGFKNGQTASIITGSLSRESGENAGNYAIGLGTLSAGSNYTITFVPADFSITRKDIAIDVTAEQSKIYGEADPTFAFTTTPALTDLPFPEKSWAGGLTRAAGQNVGSYAIAQGTLELADDNSETSLATNYNVTFTGADFSITRKDIAIDVTAEQSKIYGEADPTFAFTTTPALTDLPFPEKSWAGGLTRAAGQNVGSYAIAQGTLELADDNSETSLATNYNVTFTGADFGITRKDIAITVTSEQSKIYGDEDPTFAFTTTPAIADLPFPEKSWAGGLTRAAGQNVGSYAIAQGTLELADDNSETSLATNYNVTFTGADFGITRKDIAITVTSEQSKIYGEADPTFAFTTTPALTDLPFPEKSWAGGLTRAAGQNVGSYAIAQGTLELADDNSETSLATNYNVTFTGADFSITRKDIAIDVTAEQSKIYGEADPTFAFTTTPALTDLPFPEKSWAGGLTRAAGQNVGSYAIAQGTLELADDNSETSLATNYNVTFTGADFGITRKDIAITVTSEQSKIYGDEDPTFAFTTTPAIADLPFPEKSWAGGLTRAAGQNVGSYAIAQGTLELADDNSETSLATNYNVTFTGADFSITRKDIAIDVTAEQSKIYGEADPTFAFTTTPALTDLPFPEKSWAGGLTRAAGQNVGSYAIAQGTLELADDNSETSLATNYNVTFTGADFGITRKDIAITVTSEQSKIYGEADPTFAFTTTPALTDLPFPEKSWAGGLTRAAGQNVGSYAIAQGTLELADDNSETSLATNYNVTFTGADFGITRKDIAITVTSEQSKIYGDEDPTFAFTTTPAIADLPFPEKSWARGLTRAAGQNVGSYAIAQGTLELADDNSETSLATNYNVTFTGADFSITRKDIAIDVTAEQSKIYGEADPTFAFTTTPALTDLPFPEKSWAGGLTRAAGQNVGSYAIAQGTLELADDNSETSLATNYNVTFTGADFGITRKDIAITVTSEQSKIYGDEDPTFAFTTTPAIADLPFPEKSWAGGLTRAAGQNVGSYAIAQGTLELADDNSETSLATNYNVTFTGADFGITSHDLVITASTKNKFYGTLLTNGAGSTAFTSVGLQNNETIGSVSVAYGTGAEASALPETYTGSVTPSAATGGTFNADNYTVSYENGDIVVDKAVLTVTADAKSKTYDGSVFTPFTSTITGFVNDELVGDVVSGTVTYSGTAIAAVNAGHYTIVPVVTGLSATNYSFEAVNGTLTINSASSGGGGGGGSYDTTPPVWVTAQKALDRTVDYQDANGLIAVQALKPVASDASSFVLTKVSGSLVKSTDCIYGGTYTNTWTAKDSYGNISSVYTQVITLDKKYNDQPIIDQVKDFSVYKNSKSVEVSLSGIDPVSGCKPQEIVSLTATADNSSLVNVISVSYINGSSTGRLVLKIADNLEGESLIRVTLKDNGGSENGGSDTSEMTFKLKVVDASQGPKLSSEIPILIINPGNNFQLNLNDYFSSQNNNPVTYNATLANGTNLPSWMVFNPQTGTISGEAPQNDLGSYQIFVTSTDSQGLTTQTSFWFVNTTTGTSVVSGTVSSTTGAITDGVEVVILKIGANNQTTVIEKQVLNGSSSFAFSGLSAGAYLLNAVVTDVTKHPELLNTYYNGSSSVFTAQRIELGSQNNTGIQLLMLQKAPMISSGSISGIVTRKVGPETPDNTQVGQLAPDVDVVLKQDGKIVANTLTNLDGEYSFGLLPEGTYYVEVEQLGFVLYVVKKITISANSQNAEDVNFTIWTTGTITKVDDLATSMEISMYPNPTSGQLNIVSSNYGPVTITVFNASGKETFRKNYISGEVIKINLSDNVSGFYFVKLEGEKETVIRKIILKK